MRTPRVESKTRPDARFRRLLMLRSSVFVINLRWRIARLPRNWDDALALTTSGGGDGWRRHARKNRPLFLSVASGRRLFRSAGLATKGCDDAERLWPRSRLRLALVVGGGAPMCRLPRPPMGRLREHVWLAAAGEPSPPSPISWDLDRHRSPSATGRGSSCSHGFD